MFYGLLTTSIRYHLHGLLLAKAACSILLLMWAIMHAVVLNTLSGTQIGSWVAGWAMLLMSLALLVYWNLSGNRTLHHWQTQLNSRQADDFRTRLEESRRLQIAERTQHQATVEQLRSEVTQALALHLVQHQMHAIRRVVLRQNSPMKELPVYRSGPSGTALSNYTAEKDQAYQHVNGKFFHYSLNPTLELIDLLPSKCIRWSPRKQLPAMSSVSQISGRSAAIAGPWWKKPDDADASR